MTRRKAASILAAAPAAAIAQQQPGAPPNPKTSTQQRRPGPPPEVPPFEAPIEFGRKDVAPKVQPFAMTQVKLLPGIYADAAEWNRGYMSRHSADRLLYNFRENAGLPAGSGQPFGGWEAKADGKRGTELRGHVTGHFLSASAQLYPCAGDQAAKAKRAEIVAELAKCQAKLGGGYLSAFPTELLDRIDRNWPTARCPQCVTTLPGSALVILPSSITGTPFTSTNRMPSES